ncbi:MAG: hypothetical protein N4A35_15165 [Flavobacteriales bacterium]|jgi:hypothetical protein|nr:hypothetical protein [Flavobacteriales bacterium]
MEEFYNEDTLLIPAAKLSVRSKTVNAARIREEFSVGGRRANRLLERLVEMGILKEEEDFLYKSSISSAFILGKYFKSNQNEIDEFLDVLEKGNLKEMNPHDHGLDYEFDYVFERSCEIPFKGSILSYYLIKKCYWRRKPRLNVMIHLLENGSEVNQIIDLSGDGSYLIEYLLDLIKKAQNIESKKSAFEVLQQYIFATKGAGKYDETIEEYEDRLMLNAKN